MLVTLCIGKDKMHNLMESFPEARKFYVERAWDRRIEFRRVVKRFRRKLEDIEMARIRCDKSNMEANLDRDSSAEFSDNSDCIQSDGEGAINQ